MQLFYLYQDYSMSSYHQKNIDFQAIAFAVATNLCSTLKYMEADGLQCCKGYTEHRMQFYIKLASFDKEGVFKTHKELIEVEHQIVENVMIAPPITKTIDTDDGTIDGEITGEGSFVKIVDDIQAYQKLRNYLLKTAIGMDYNNSYWKHNYKLNMDRVGRYAVNNDFNECTENLLIKIHKLHKDTK